MLLSRFRSISPRFRVVDEFQHLDQLNCNFVPSNQFNGNPRNKPHNSPRLHNRQRRKCRDPIPFLDHLKECQNPDDYLTIFHDFREMGHKHGYPSIASLVYKLARARKFDDVDRVLDFLQTRDVKCDEAMYIGLIRHYGKVDMFDKAVEVFREMGRSFNCVRTVQSFNTVLNVLVNGDRISQAVELFEKGRGLGFRLNSVSYNIMIKMWLGKDDWESAQKVFDEMLEREIQPTPVTYNSQIGYFCKKGEVDKARKIFEDMRRKGRIGNAVTYALLMEGLCTSGQFKEAKKVMFDMEYHGCEVHLKNYGVLMTHLAKRGSMDEAKDLLAEMKKRWIKPDVVTYNILISSLCKEGSGGVAEAYKMLVDMQLNGREPNAATYRMVVDGLCRIGDFSSGLRVLNAMLHSSHLPRVETFNQLSVGLIRNGEVDDACYLMEEMGRRKMVLSSDSWELVVKECCDGDSSVGARLDRVVTILWVQDSHTRWSF